MPYLRDQFDFEIGYLVKSPCKDCRQWVIDFPECTDECSTLDGVHTLLARGISCTRSLSAFESYALCLQGWDKP